MANSSQQPPRPTLEDLLRFKRLERPAPEFWAEFDRGLRQKQLAALVKRPKGWARVRPVFVRGLRWAVPATAAAAVATVVVQMPLGLATRETPVEVASRTVDAVANSTNEQQQHLEPMESASRSVSVAQGRAEDVASLVSSETTAESGPSAAGRNSQGFPWSTIAFSTAPSSEIGGTGSFAIRPTSREARRPRSSWTSRFNQLVHELGSEVLPGATVQFASLDLTNDATLDSQVAASAVPGRFVAGASGLGRETDERTLRELDRRFGATGSSLSIKF